MDFAAIDDFADVEAVKEVGQRPHHEAGWIDGAAITADMAPSPHTASMRILDQQSDRAECKVAAKTVVPIVNFTAWPIAANRAMNCLMRDVLKLIWWGLIGLLRSRASLEAEILVLRHQVNVLRRRSPKRLAFSNLDHLILPASMPFRRAILECFGDRRTPNGRPLASCRLSLVLALEVAVTQRQTNGAARNSPADPRDEPRQSSLGRSEDPWRTSQARHRCGPNLSRQIHGKAQETSFPTLEDVPAQSCRWHRIDRSIRRSDDLISAAVWPSDFTT